LASGDRANPRPELALHSRCSTQAVEIEPDLLFSAGLMERAVNGNTRQPYPAFSVSERMIRRSDSGEEQRHETGQEVSWHPLRLRCGHRSTPYGGGR
jgi:hypothetical protein